MPSSPFTSEAERLRAREAAYETLAAFDYPGAIDEYQQFLDKFDEYYPPIVDAPLDPTTEWAEDMGAVDPTPPDFDAAVEELERLVTWLRAWACLRSPDRPTDEEVHAARQRLRELYEAVVRERDEVASRPVPPDSGRARYPMTDIRRDFIHRALMHPGFVGDRDLFVDVARDLAAEINALRAAQQGEEYPVQDHAETGEIAVYFDRGEFTPGDRVRITRVEEGA